VRSSIRQTRMQGLGGSRIVRGEPCRPRPRKALFALIGSDSGLLGKATAKSMGDLQVEIAELAPDLVPMSALLRYHGERLPENAPAVTCGADTLSWRELEARANRRARQYIAMGVKPGDFVTLSLPNGVQFFECSFAVWKAGAIPNVVSAKMPVAEVKAILELVRPSLVVGHLSEELTGWRTLPLSTSTEGYGAEALPDLVAPYWKATTSSGSTGRPKVIVTHQPAAWNPTAGVSWLMPGETHLCPGPLYQNAPFLTLHMALFTGGHAVALERFDAETTLREIERHRVQALGLVPTMMNRIWALPAEIRQAYDLSSLRVAEHYGAPISPELKEAWIGWLGPERIVEMYGGSEGQGATEIWGDDWLRKRGSVGRPIPGWEISIRDEQGRPVPQGEYGDIAFRSKTANGEPFHYLGAESIIRSDGWGTLGDIGRIDEDGYLFLADRRTDMIVRGGENVYPAEIEGTLENHPGIASAIVVGLPDPDLGQRVHAIVHLRPGAECTPQEIDAWMRSRLARYKLPQSYEFVDDFLRDEGGKARRGALRDLRAQWLAEGREFRQLV